jgi:hypothetical protein
MPAGDVRTLIKQAPLVRRRRSDRGDDSTAPRVEHPLVQMQRLYGNQAVQGLLASTSILQRLKIPVKGSVTEGKGSDKRRVEKAVVIDTDEKDDAALLTQITEARKIDSQCIDMLDETGLLALDARFQKVAAENVKAFAPNAKKVRIALANRKSEKEEAVGDEFVISEQEPKDDLLSPEEGWAKAIASLDFKFAVTDKFTVDHVLQVDSADDELAVKEAAKKVFEDRRRTQPSLSASTLVVFDASARGRALAEMKAVNTDLKALPYRGKVLTTLSAYVMVKVSKPDAEQATVLVERTTKPFLYTTDDSSLFVMEAKKHTRAMNHFEGSG